MAEQVPSSQDPQEWDSATKGREFAEAWYRLSGYPMPPLVKNYWSVEGGELIDTNDTEDTGDGESK